MVPCIMQQRQVLNHTSNEASNTETHRRMSWHCLHAARAACHISCYFYFLNSSSRTFSTQRFGPLGWGVSPLIAAHRCLDRLLCRLPSREHEILVEILVKLQLLGCMLQCRPMLLDCSQHDLPVGLQLLGCMPERIPMMLHCGQHKISVGLQLISCIL